MIKNVKRIKCPATKVFDLAADVRNELRWNSDISKVDLKTDGPIGKGSRFAVVDKRGQHEATITVFNRPERLEFLMLDDKMDVEIVLELTEADSVTTMTSTFTGKPRGLMKLLFPLLQPLIKREIDKKDADFIRICETQG